MQIPLYNDILTQVSLILQGDSGMDLYISKIIKWGSDLHKLGISKLEGYLAHFIRKKTV